MKGNIFFHLYFDEISMKKHPISKSTGNIKNIPRRQPSVSTQRWFRQHPIARTNTVLILDQMLRFLIYHFTLPILMNLSTRVIKKKSFYFLWGQPLILFLDVKEKFMSSLKKWNKFRVPEIKVLYAKSMGFLVKYAAPRFWQVGSKFTVWCFHNRCICLFLKQQWKKI